MTDSTQTRDPKPFMLLPFAIEALSDPAAVQAYEDEVQAIVDEVTDLQGMVNMNVLVVGDSIVTTVNIAMLDRDPMSGQQRAVPATTEAWKKALKRKRTGLI